jgi:hypothetical protein
MKILSGILCISLPALMAVTPCQGAIAVTWLDEPISLWTEWTSQYEPLDLNGDGLSDFVFGASTAFVGARSEGDNQYLIWPSGGLNIGGDIEPLSEDYEIGPDSGDDSWIEWFGHETDFANLITRIYSGGPVCVGRFVGQRAYMGVEFDINGAMHYGWIDLYVASHSAAAAIYGWGYDTDPGVSILAGAVAVPEPSTTMLLIGGLLTIGCTLRRAKARRG